MRSRLLNSVLDVEQRLLSVGVFVHQPDSNTAAVLAISRYKWGLPVQPTPSARRLTIPGTLISSPHFTMDPLFIEQSQGDRKLVEFTDRLVPQLGTSIVVSCVRTNFPPTDSRYSYRKSSYTCRKSIEMTMYKREISLS